MLRFVFCSMLPVQTKLHAITLIRKTTTVPHSISINTLPWVAALDSHFAKFAMPRATWARTSGCPHLTIPSNALIPPSPRNRVCSLSAYKEKVSFWIKQQQSLSVPSLVFGYKLVDRRWSSNSSYVHIYTLGLAKIMLGPTFWPMTCKIDTSSVDLTEL